jgi:hypothetical protein
MSSPSRAVIHHSLRVFFSDGLAGGEMSGTVAKCREVSQIVTPIFPDIPLDMLLPAESWIVARPSLTQRRQPLEGGIF